jgi:hypothetical protein
MPVVHIDQISKSSKNKTSLLTSSFDIMSVPTYHPQKVRIHERYARLHKALCECKDFDFDEGTYAFDRYVSFQHILIRDSRGNELYIDSKWIEEVALVEEQTCMTVQVAV